MKKMKRILAVLLVALMALGLCACGDKDGGNKGSGAAPANTPAPEFVYNATYTGIKNSVQNNWLTPNLCTDKGFYSSTQEKIGENIPEGVTPEWEGQYDVWATVMYFVDYDGNMTKLENFKSYDREREEGHDGSSYIRNMMLTPDGSLLVFEDYSEYWSDAPDGTEMYSDLWYENYRSSTEYYIRVLDETGAEKSCARLQIPEEIASPTDGSWFYPYGVAIDNEGNLILASEKKVLGFDMDGNMLGVFDMGNDQWTDRVLRLTDGRVAILVWGSNGYELDVVNMKNKGFSEKLTMPSNVYDAVMGGGDYDLYYTNGVNFCGYRFDTKQTDILFNWVNCDVNNDYLNGVNVLDDGTVVGVVNTWDKNYENCTSEIVKVSKVPYSSVPHKDTITLATQYLDWETRDLLINFNRKNDQYRIEVNDYSAFNTEEDYSAGLTKLRTEIMAGNVPDIIDLNGLPLDQMAAKGILEDLYPYLDADSGLSREDFFPNILKALEYNGQLCATCSSFSIQTVMGAASLVGDKPGWTYDELFAALDQMPEDCRIFDYYVTRYDVLRQGLQVDMGSFCDWSTGKCSFDSESFKNLLRFANRFPAEFDWDNFEYTSEDDAWTLISQGRQMLMMTDLYSLTEAGLYEAIFGEHGSTYIGFPTEEGTGNMIRLNSGYAMSKNCRNKDAAWEFLRTFFTEDFQSDAYGIQTNIHAYQKQIEDAMTPQYRLTSDGDAMLDEDGEKIKESRGSFYLASGDVVEYYELSQEQADKIYELITTTTKIVSDSDAIYSIVAEQAEAYFLGQKSVDEVAKLIQSKANIYVNEQR